MSFAGSGSGVDFLVLPVWLIGRSCLVVVSVVSSNSLSETFCLIVVSVVGRSSLSETLGTV